MVGWLSGLGSGLMSGLGSIGSFAAQNPTLTGSLVGAGVGQLVGGDTKSTLGGAAIGGTLGYGAGNGLFGEGVSNSLANYGQGSYNVANGLSQGFSNMFGGTPTGTPAISSGVSNTTGTQSQIPFNMGVERYDQLSNVIGSPSGIGGMTLNYNPTTAGSYAQGLGSPLLSASKSVGPVNTQATKSIFGGLFNPKTATAFGEYAKGLGGIAQTYSGYQSAQDQKKAAQDQMMLKQINYNREFDLSQKGFDQTFSQNEQRFKDYQADRDRAIIEREAQQAMMSGVPLTTTDAQGNVIRVEQPENPTRGVQGAFAGSALANMYA